MKSIKQYLVLAQVIVLIFLVGCTNSEVGFKSPATDKIQPWTDQAFMNDPMDFQFAIVTDRTGGCRAGVFREAVTQLNLLQPEFVMSVGDLIEGYTENHDTLSQQYDEMDEILSNLEMRFFRVPGNHDISNNVMLNMYHERYGLPYYHFVYKNTLFLVISTEDPPFGNISDTQVNYIQEALNNNMNVRWTFVFMHRPLFVQPGDKQPEGWVHIDSMLLDRPHTVFIGHTHHYNKYEKHGQSYICLATTGGASELRGTSFGEFDHIVWITMTDKGPIIANLLLDGIFDENVKIAE